MHLATLVTNTDDSAFARAHPLDDAKFATLIAETRPGWRCTAFWVCRDEFPAGLDGFDGVMITGSPASVLDPAPWIARLEALVRRLIADRVPLFGACFGHQVIARALGAEIRRNPDGWAHGLIPMTRAARLPWSGPQDALSLYGSHLEQVRDLPPGARVTWTGPGCPIAGFHLDRHVMTVQHHPEMTHDFITALVHEYAPALGPQVTGAARASLAAGRADRAAFAEEIARFFEGAG